MPMVGVDMAQVILREYAGVVGGGHTQETPLRFLNMLREMTQCSPTRFDTPKALNDHFSACVKWKIFESDVDQMIVVQNIPVTSVCAHHIVPFVGTAAVGYIPDGHIAGLSKFARVVRHFARRPQVQEELTEQVHDFIDSQLEPQGVAVIMRCEHMCMTLRGVQAPGTYTTTSKLSGAFADHDRTAKAEFLSLVNA